jgi:hypothetical protein
MVSRAFSLFVLLLVSGSVIPSPYGDTLNLPDRFWVRSLGFTHSVFRDKSLSPLIYRGKNLHVATGFERRSEKNIQQAELNIAPGRAYPDIFPAFTRASILNLRTEIFYFYFHDFNILVRKRIKFLPGLSFNNFLFLKQHNYYTNNQFGYDFSSSLSLGALFVDEFTLFNKRFRTDYRFSMPLVQFIVRPYYVTSIPSGFLGITQNDPESILRSGSIMSGFEYIRLNNRFGLEYPLKNGNIIRLSYSWDFIHHNTFDGINRSIGAFHTILFSTGFNF